MLGICPTSHSFKLIFLKKQWENKQIWHFHYSIEFIWNGKLYGWNVWKFVDIIFLWGAESSIAFTCFSLTSLALESWSACSSMLSLITTTISAFVSLISSTSTTCSCYSFILLSLPIWWHLKASFLDYSLLA